MFNALKVLELASVLAGPSVGQFFAEFYRRHLVVFIRRRDALDHFALRKIAGNDGGVSRFQFLERLLLKIKAQISLARFGIRPVAGVAILRKYRANIAIEINGFCFHRSHRNREQHSDRR